MVRFALSSLRVRLLLLVLLAVVPALGLALHAGREQRRLATAEARVEAARLARLAASQQERLLAGAEQFLAALTRIPATHGGDLPACGRILADFHKAYGLFTNISSVTPSGDVRCAALPLTRPVNVADRGYFQRALRSRQFAVGEFAVGRATGKPSLFLAYPVFDPAGEAKAVLTAGLDLTWLNELAAQVHLSPGGSLTLVDDRGVVLARHPDPERWVGKPALEEPAVRAALDRSGSGTLEATGSDGASLLVAFSALTHPGTSGHRVIVALRREAAFAEVDRLQRRNLAGLALVSLLALAAAWVGGDWLVLRPGRRLVEAAHRVTAGDLGARSGIPHQAGELGLLAGAFDEMAASVERRLAERDRAEAARRESEARLRLAVESSDTGLWDWDIRAGRVHFSAVWKRQLGYAEDELPDRFEEWESRLHPEDREGAVARVQAYLRSPSPSFESEFRLRHRDGSYRWILARAALVLDEGGRPARMLGSHLDVTERKRAEQTARALAEVGRDLAGTLDPTEAADRVVTAVGRLFGAYRCVLYRVEPGSGSLTCVAARGEAGAERWVGVVIPAGEGVAGWVIREGRSVLSEDILADPRFTRPAWLRERLQADGSHSVLATPLVARGETLGALTLGRPSSRAFTESDLRTLGVFADHAALALQNAHHYEEAERGRREAEILAALAASIGASLELGAVFQRLVDGARELCRSDLAHVALRDPGSEAMTFRTWSGARRTGPQSYAVEPGRGVGGQVLLTGRPFRTDRYAEDPRISRDYVPTIEQEGITASMAVPILMEGRAEGLLFVDNRAARPFTDRDEAVLVRLAEHAAVAIANARLFAQEQEARAAAQAARRQVAGILERVSDAFVALDADWRYTYVNEKAARTFGRRPEDLIGKHIWTEFPEGVGQPFYHAYRRAMAEQVPVELEEHYPPLDRWFWNRIYPSPEGLSIFFHDVTERKRSEQALRESEERFATIVRVSPVAISVFTVADGRLVDANDAFLRLFGLGREVAIGRTTIELNLWADPRDRAELVEALRERGSVRDREVRIRGRSGEPGLVLTSLETIELGGTPHVLSMFLDITERKRAEEALRESEARFRALAETSASAVLVYQDDRLVYTNPAASAISGYSRQELLGRTIWDLIHPDHREPIERRRAARQAGEPVPPRAELRIVTKSGEERWIDYAVGFAEVGGRRLSVGTAFDVTERKHAQEALQAYVERLGVLHTISQGVLEAEAPAEIAQRALRRLRRLVGSPRAVLALFDFEAGEVTCLVVDVEGETRIPAGTRFPIETLGMAESLDELRRGRMQVVTDVLALSPPELARILLAEGVRSYAVIPLMAQGTLIGSLNFGARQPGGPAPEAVQIAREVAGSLAIAIQQARLREDLQRHAAELERRVDERTAELRESTAELDAFAYSIAHDLRAPLRAMQGFATALLEDYGDRLEPAGRDYASRVVTAAQQMDVLIRDLLAYSRLSRAELMLGPVSLEAVARETLAELEEELRLRDARLKVDQPLPEVRGHRVTLGQVLINLVTNAVKFVAPGVRPAVRIRAETRDGWVRLWVEDNGIGIAPDHQARIFQAFERLHGVERYPGTGIGLAIVRRGVERMGGRVGVESAPGQGSRFWVELRPASPEASP